MLDHDDRDVELVADVEDVAGGVLGLLEVHARHGLVQQEQLGLHRQGPPELDPLLHAVRQQAHRERPPLLELEEVHDLLDDAPVGDLLRPGPPAPEERREEAVAEVLVATEHQVVQHGEVLEERDVLEGAGHPEVCDPVRPHAEDALAEELHAAALRPVDTGEDVEDRGLAGAVGADDGEQLARTDLEGRPRDRVDPREGQVHVLDAHHGPLGGPGLLAHADHRFLRR